MSLLSHCERKCYSCHFDGQVWGQVTGPPNDTDCNFRALVTHEQYHVHIYVIAIMYMK